MKVNEFIPTRTLEILNSQSKNEKKQESLGFSNILKEKLDDVNEFQVKNEKNTKDFVDGKIDMHQVMIGATEAKISLQFALEVRNKLVEAYTEINRMQL